MKKALGGGSGESGGRAILFSCKGWSQNAEMGDPYFSEP